MDEEQNRINSFENFPKRFLSAEQMAKSGFYYSGEADIVCCIYCNVRIGNWEEGDDPDADHTRWSPFCNRGQPNRARDVAGYTHSSFSSFNDRIVTFNSWTNSFSAQKLADAGFVYTGIDDKVFCFTCYVGFYAWKSNDDAFFEHAKLSPNCNYVKFIKGEHYIAKVQKEVELMKAEEKKLNEKSDNLCKICFKNKSNVVFDVCGHKCCCEECAEKLTDDKCIMCRKSTTQIISSKTAINEICAKCWVNEIDMMFYPCGHEIICQECTTIDVPKTCLCKASITKCIKLYK